MSGGEPTEPRASGVAAPAPSLPARLRPRAIAAGLLLFTGAAHLAEYLLRSHDRSMAIAGAIYFALGIGLRRPGKVPLIVGAILPALGALGGAQRMLAAPALDPILAGMVAIDVAVVACCGLALARRERDEPPA